MTRAEILVRVLEARHAYGAWLLEQPPKLGENQTMYRTRGARLRQSVEHWVSRLHRAEQAVLKAAEPVHTLAELELTGWVRTGAR